MKVRARQNVRDASGWHLTGQVFETDADLGEAVEVLDTQKAEEPEAVQVEPVREEPVAKEPVQEAPKTRSRRKSTAK